MACGCGTRRGAGVKGGTLFPGTGTGTGLVGEPGAPGMTGYGPGSVSIGPSDGMAPGIPQQGPCMGQAS